MPLVQGKGAEYRMSGYNEIGAMNFAEGFLLAGEQADRPQIREAKLITDHFGLEKDAPLGKAHSGKLCMTKRGTRFRVGCLLSF